MGGVVPSRGRRIVGLNAHPVERLLVAQVQFVKFVVGARRPPFVHAAEHPGLAPVLHQRMGTSRARLLLALVRRRRPGHDGLLLHRGVGSSTTGFALFGGCPRFDALSARRSLGAASSALLLRALVSRVLLREVPALPEACYRIAGRGRCAPQFFLVSVS